MPLCIDELRLEEWSECCSALCEYNTYVNPAAAVRALHKAAVVHLDDRLIFD